MLWQTALLDLARDGKLLDMKDITLIRNHKGFTLLELMSVLVILGVLFSVAIKKYDLLTDSASKTALKAGVRELNTQESLVWIDMKLSDTGWTADVDVYNAVEKNLGQGYGWNPGPAITGGTLHYKSQSVALVRNQSTRQTVGSWL
jgi:prepilin-type N-terminal cleavage/methylation domain-containing protein